MRFRITQIRTTVEEFVHIVDAPTREDAENTILCVADADEEGEVVDETFTHRVEEES